MLHLAIICIVCAVSALNEGITNNGYKNSENDTFCLSNEGGQTIAKVIFPCVYNVDVHNSSDCAKQKITNRTSSFFYDNIIKQYRSRKNSCSIMENVSLEEKKNTHSNPNSVHRKRNLLWRHHSSNSLEGVENLQMKNQGCVSSKEEKKKAKKKGSKNHNGLTQEEKKLFLRLKNLKATNPGHLYFFEMKDLDLSQRIQALSKKLKSENETALKSSGKFLILENIKKLLSFKKDSNKKIHSFDSDSALCSVNNLHNPATRLFGSIPSTIKKITQELGSRNNHQALYSNKIDLGPILKKKLVPKPYPYSARFKAEKNFLYPKNEKSVYKSEEKEDNALISALLTPQKKLDNWPFLSNFHQHHSRVYNKRKKRHEKPLFVGESNLVDAKIYENVFTKHPFGVDSSTLPTEYFTESSNPPEKNGESLLFEHTIEKPFLQRGSMNEMFHNQNLKTEETDWDPLIDSPFYHESIHGFSTDDLLTHYLLSIRHAFKRFLNENNLWESIKREKRTSRKKGCTVPRKCWRSAPLLCIPYIKKGQEEVLKYILKFIQDLMGKPIPPKSDIFGKTKYKPNKKKSNDDNCEEETEFDYADCGSSIAHSTKTPKTTSSPPTPSASRSSLAPTTLKMPSTKAHFSPNSAGIAQLTNTSSLKNLKDTGLSIFSHINEMRDNNKISEVENQIPEQPFLFTPIPTIPVPVDSSCPSNSPSTQKPPSSVGPNPSTSSATVTPNPTPTSTPAVEVTQSPTPVTSRVAASDSAINSCTTLSTGRLAGQDGFYPFTPKVPHGAYQNIQPQKLAKLLLSTPENQDNINKNLKKKSSHLMDFDKNYENLKNIWPNIEKIQPSLTNHLPLDSLQVFDEYQPQDEEKENNLEVTEESVPDYFCKSDNFIENKNSPEYRLNNLFNKRKGYHFSDYFLNEDDTPNKNINLGTLNKKLGKKKHQRRVNKKNHNLAPTEPSFDYYAVGESPIRKTHKMNLESRPKKIRRNHRRRGSNRKMKKIENKDSLSRKKREDDYFWPDFYDSYLDDSDDNDESTKKPPNVSDKKPDENASYPVLDAPSYEMFNELAKAITGSDTKDSTAETESSNISTGRTTIGYVTATTAAGNKKKVTQKSEVQKSLASSSTDNIQTQTDNIDNTDDIQIQSQTHNTDNTQIQSQTQAEKQKSSIIQTTVSSSSEPPVKKISTGKIRNSRKEEKETKGNQESGNDGQVPTTLKTAAIVKGPKKLLTKPSPKVYSKVFPDSFEFGGEGNETSSTTMATSPVTSKVFLESKTALLSSTLKPDARLQLLAVCEGYLEIIKRIKALNQSFGEDIDAELARHCESVISQSFNNQLEKPKKAELNEAPIQTFTLSPAEDVENVSKITQTVTQSSKKKSQEKSELQRQEKLYDDDITDEPTIETETSKENKVKKKKLKSKSRDQNLTKSDSTESPKKKKKKSSSKKKKKKSTKSLHKDEETNEEKVSPKDDEQVKLINVLKQRKRALMSWLLSSKDQYKSEDLPETEYFDDEDFIPPDSDFSEYSGTIKPKRNDIVPERKKQSLYKENDSVFPIYAKHYGYDKGGELREVEVLWRTINEKTHEEKILKNLSVIAFLMTSTISPKNFEDAKLRDNKRYEGEDPCENELNRGGHDGEVSDEDKASTESSDENTTEAIQNNSTETTTTNATSVTKPPKKNGTHTFISKPDPASIVGSPPLKNKTKASNITHKVTKKLGVAKDLFQEYNIEFLNYAVYILPAMFTIIFLFCCFGCAIYILKTKRSFKKRRKKKKAYSTDETSETTDYSDDVPKKRKRKKKSKNNDGGDGDSEKKLNKKFWNVLKLASKNKENDEDGQAEKKNFLRFLKGKKDNRKNDKFKKNYEDSGDEKGYDSGEYKNKHKKDEHKSDDSEAIERRELISLLEELKKIELEHTGEKKEVKSVHVQYTSQLDENPFRRPEFAYPYEKNVFGLPKGYFFTNKKFPIEQRDSSMVKDYELYEDVNEMAELLPCEYNNHFGAKNDCLRPCDFQSNQEGRCKRFFKIFRDSGVNQNQSFRNKNFTTNENENRNFIFNKYRNINTDSGEEVVRVTTKNAGTEVKSLSDSESPLRLSSANNPDLEEMDKREFNKKKYVRLKDDGVLCRL